MRPLSLVFSLVLLAGCGPFGLPDDPVEKAAYYVASHTSGSVTASTIAIAYETPEGTRRDTLRGALASWSKVYDRDALPSFSITAENLTPPDTAGNAGIVAVSLIINQETVAFDSSRTVVSLQN